MAGAALTADFSQFGALQRKIDRLQGLMDDDLREGIGAILENSARRRFTTKLGPDGQPWPGWSPGYAARRPGGKSLLMDSGALADSVQYEVGPDSVTVFEPMEHAATHQFGDNRTIKVGGRLRKRNIPARPTLGFGDEDAEEVERLVDGLTERAFQ